MTSSCRWTLCHICLLVTLALWNPFSPPTTASATVLTGIDVLAHRHFDLLQGRRVGLITNQSGRSVHGDSTIDLLATAPGVTLVALFSPEHGIRGQADAKIASATDRRTGLPVYSLYGASCRPTPQMLNGIDLLVFDIQDIGTRFYTYIGTLYYALQAAQERGIPLVVLDRPDPLGGEAVQGATPDPGEVARRMDADRTGCRSLAAIYPLPTRYGLTIGELARFFNREAGINADLRVVPMAGWQRGMLWNDTGLSWVNPSPNMKDPMAELLYPGFGPLEATNLSVGRGTDAPFHRFGAPWLDAPAVLQRLPRLPGLRFSITSFTPTAAGYPYRGRLCHGIEVTVTDPQTANVPLAALYLAQAIYRTHPRQYRAEAGFYGMLGDTAAWQLLTAGAPPEQIISRWQTGIATFERMSTQYWLY